MKKYLFSVGLLFLAAAAVADITTSTTTRKYIYITNTLIPGATTYLSSATVRSLNVGTVLTFPDGTTMTTAAIGTGGGNVFGGGSGAANRAAFWNTASTLTSSGNFQFFGSSLAVNGYIRSDSGGFVFPDGSTQTTAAAGSGGNVTGSGAAGEVTYWQTSSTLTSSGNMTFNGSTLTVNGSIVSSTGGIVFPDGTRQITSAISPTVTGVILQSTSITKTDTFTDNSNDDQFHDITGMSVTLTPTSSTSKVYVVVSLGAVSNTTALTDIGLTMRVTRNGTPVGVGNSAGSRLQSGGSCFVRNTNYECGTAWSFLDAPASTSALTYQVQVFTDMGLGGGPTINRSGGDGNVGNSNNARTASTITAFEVSGQ